MVIGLDGATLDLAGPWLQAGLLPNLAKLRQRGGAGRLRSVWPVLSPSAWASFATGVNPGRHGVFDFAQRAPNSYQLKLVTSQDLRAPTLWRLLSEAGKRVAVINVPMTYPAESVNGVLITGLGTPDQQVFSHPPELSSKLRAQGYRVNKSVFYRPGREDAFLKDVYAMTYQVGETALSLLKQEPWDFFMVVFRDTDELAHYFWKHMDAEHPAHNHQHDEQWASTLKDYYIHLDQWIGRLVDAAGPDVDILVMSDHGMGPLYKDVYLNDWLRQQGWLKTVARPYPPGGWLGQLGLTRSSVSEFLQTVGLAKFERWLRARLGKAIQLLPANNRYHFPDAIDWSHTQAYSYGYHGQVYLNVIGREPAGIVATPADYERVLSMVENGLKGLQDPDDGRPIVSNILRQQDAFQGPYASLGADLVIVMRDMSYITRQGYEFSPSHKSFVSRPNSFESGSHRIDGLLFFGGPSFHSILDIPTCSILDLAPTIMYILGLEVSNKLDGQVLLDYIADNNKLTTNLTDAYHNIEALSDKNLLTESEEQELLERLRNLGYLS